MIMNKSKIDLSDPQRFRPVVDENDKRVITMYRGLCKSCGECIVKCPVKCISWDKEELGQLGEPSITIDNNVCIGCETCENICPDFAIEISNKPKPAAKK